MYGEGQTVNYFEIVEMSLGYADRRDDPELRIQDPSTAAPDDSWAINRMLRIVESRINRRLQNRDMSKRAYINTSLSIEYYGLPPDFGGLRDIEVRNVQGSSNRITMEFVTPEYMNKIVQEGNQGFYYTVINNQVQIHPRLDNWVLEVIYYQKIPPLSTTKAENWVSVKYPDAYIQGLMVELSSYTKDSEAAVLWENRFNTTIEEMVYEDAIDRWSGPTPTIRLM